MKVLQINSVRNIFTQKGALKQRVSDFVERVKYRLSPSYALKVTNNQVQDLRYSYLKNHPEIIKRSEAVKGFIQNNRFALPKLNDDAVSCLTAKAEDLLKSCGDNLEKIYNLMGAYGLQLYGSIMLTYKDVLGDSHNRNVSENGYFSDKKIKLAFDEYMDKNDKGNVKDIYHRFGQCGKTLLDRYFMTGCVRNGSATKVDGTYRTTDNFDLLVRDIDLPVGRSEYKMNTRKEF